MSGQYPPPNPYSGHHHQRAPPSPWAHSHPPHPQTLPSGMVWSPHMGHTARGAQMWTPKPLDSRPLYGLEMMMGGSQYSQQQEETMDLSSSAQDLPKTLGDPLRNGSVNGESESIVTSVIAPNPLRETLPTDALNCSKRLDDVWEGSDHSLSAEVPEDTAVGLVSKHEPTDLDRLSDFSFSDTFVKETEEHSSQRLESVSKNLEGCDVKADKESNPHSYLDSSFLSVDTDESRLVVAESSTDDIFGMSPVDTPGKSSTLDRITDGSAPKEQWPLRHEVSAVPAPKNVEPHPSVENVETLLESMFNSQEETSCSSQTSSSGVPQSVIVSSGLRTAVETIDRTSPMKEEELAKTLAEDTPLESTISTLKKEELAKPFLEDTPTQRISPMKEEDLAKTLSEEMPPESSIKDCKLEVSNEKLEDVKIEELLNNVDKSCKSSVENSVPDVPNTDDQIKETNSIPELDLKDSKVEVVKEVDCDNNLFNNVPELLKKEQPTEPDENLPGPSTSSNPFIEVETQLEKMFAGIVEPLDEVSSDAQQSVLEPSKLSPSNKKPTRKRKRANNRRPSDNSVFGGSSGDSPPLKKKGRKRMRDSSGFEKNKKIRMDGGEHSRKGKAMKELNEGLSSKVKGPFVHIEGSKESPASVVVVNSGSRADDDDGLDKVSNRWKHSRQKQEGARKAGPAYNASTLSMRYNAETPDATWVCVFCKRGPHCVGGLGGEPAGDLFGPYRVPMTPPSEDKPPQGTPRAEEVAEEQKRLGGGKFPKSLRACGAADAFVTKVGKKSKRSASHDSVDYQPGLLPVGDSYEVWLHEQCAVWAPGLCIIGTQLVGLDDTVWAALRTKCWQCGVAGAGLGCVAHNCPSRMHYACAKVSGWLLDPDTFIARCQSHRTRLRP